MLFSLSTLDTRITPKKLKSPVSSSRWSTWEFRFYLLAFVIVVPLMFKSAMEASNETNPNYPRFERLLSPGWIFNRKVDNSDAQYRFFRDNAPLLAALVSAHVLLRVVLPFLSRTQYDLMFGGIFLVAAHGVNCFRVLSHVLAMFVIARVAKNYYKLAVLCCWVFGVGTLFFNNWFRSLQFGSLLSVLSPLDGMYKGIIPRWDVFFNFTLLRMLSFNLDYLERYYKITTRASPVERKRSGSALPAIEEETGPLDERARLTAPLAVSDYTLTNYLAYVFYTPLFIAGPVITFNDFWYQTRNPLPYNVKRIVLYALRFAFCVLVMEFLLHYMYVVAVSKTKAWQGNSPFQNSMVGLFNLNIIWLKLLIPWRLFRLWALMDGIDPPENMIRCMSNNFSALAFWRAWHRSYNKWVVRYIYVPLGGSGNRIVTSLAVFTFVAIWHDIELKLLLWGWLVVLFLMPEIFASAYFARYSGMWWYRHLCAAGCVLNIWMMMVANLFGFCLGQDGTVALLNDMLFTSDGLVFFFAANAGLFIAVQIMFELREGEKRGGVDVRC